MSKFQHVKSFHTQITIINSNFSETNRRDIVATRQRNYNNIYAYTFGICTEYHNPVLYMNQFFAYCVVLPVVKITVIGFKTLFGTSIYVINNSLIYPPVTCTICTLYFTVYLLYGIPFILISTYLI